MKTNENIYDLVILGGGFYGCALACYAVENFSLSKVLIIEKNTDIISQSSARNQARVHNGYHYPRSFTTGFRSRKNFPRFVKEYTQCIKKDFTKLYAIARRNSKVTAKQFERFAHDIGAMCNPASPSYKKLFNPNLIAEVYETQEYIFDYKKLRLAFEQKLNERNVTVMVNTSAVSINQDQQNCKITCSNQKKIMTRRLLNCTYSGLNQFAGDFKPTSTKLKHEIAELALVDLPQEIKNIGITVMDGPFFSIMPYPSGPYSTLSHVRYTPHFHWEEDIQKENPYDILDHYAKQTRFDRMYRDALKYLPILKGAQYKESLFEIKTILMKNEVDDGRPILFETHTTLPNFYSILGGKLDNIYDAFEHLDTLWRTL